MNLMNVGFISSRIAPTAMLIHASAPTSTAALRRMSGAPQPLQKTAPGAFGALHRPHQMAGAVGEGAVIGTAAPSGGAGVSLGEADCVWESRGSFEMSMQSSPVMETGGRLTGPRRATE